MLMLQATGQWTTLTRQEINVKKSLAFAVQHTARGTRKAQGVELNGETLPREHEFRQLGIGVLMHPKRGTGPLLTKRVQEAQTSIEKITIPPLGIRWAGVNSSSDDHRGSVVWSGTSGHLQEDGGSTGVHGHVCAMGPKQTMIVFALLVPGHRVAPTMVIPYQRMCWLARQARTRGTPQTIIQAIWEAVPTPKVTGPLGRALQEIRKLGWQPLMGWWK